MYAVLTQPGIVLVKRVRQRHAAVYPVHSFLSFRHRWGFRACNVAGAILILCDACQLLGEGVEKGVLHQQPLQDLRRIEKR